MLNMAFKDKHQVYLILDCFCYQLVSIKELYSRLNIFSSSYVKFKTGKKLVRQYSLFKVVKCVRMFTIFLFFLNNKIVFMCSVFNVLEAISTMFYRIDISL